MFKKCILSLTLLLAFVATAAADVGVSGYVKIWNTTTLKYDPVSCQEIDVAITVWDNGTVVYTGTVATFTDADGYFLDVKTCPAGTDCMGVATPKNTYSSLSGGTAYDHIIGLGKGNMSLTFHIFEQP